MQATPRVGVAIGDFVLDLREVEQFFTGPELAAQREVMCASHHYAGSHCCTTAGVQSACTQCLYESWSPSMARGSLYSPATTVT